MSQLSGNLIKPVSIQFGGMRRRERVGIAREPVAPENEFTQEDFESILNTENRDDIIQGVRDALANREINGIANDPELRGALQDFLDAMLDGLEIEGFRNAVEAALPPDPQHRVIVPQDEIVIESQGQEEETQQGEGILMRDPGKLQPAGRKLLEQVGNEEIKTIDIVRTPLSSFTRGFLNVISLGQFDKISKKYYDEMFHLSLWINGKYNLEKNEVVNFNTTNPRKSNSQVKSVSVIPAGITIQQLIDNTIKRMGPENFSNYDAERLNCQNFLLNVLAGSGIGDKADQDFIFQDATQIFKELPEYSKVLGKVSVKLGAIFNRLLYGEGDQEGGANREQIAAASIARTWMIDEKGNPLYNPRTPGITYKDGLNSVVHSGDRRPAPDNPYADIYNNFSYKVDKDFDWTYIKNYMITRKDEYILGRTMSKIQPEYPVRTLGL